MYLKIFISATFLIVPTKCYIELLGNSSYLSNYEVLERIKRQEEGQEEVARALICDFGSGSLLQTCGWTVPIESHPKMRWRTGQGAQAFWMGGPRNDHTLADTSGGYIYFETSYNPKQMQLPPVKSTQSPNVTIPHVGPASSSQNTLLRPLLSKFPIFQPSSETTVGDFPIPTAAFFQGPNITDSGPQGLCLTFYYIIQGLSSDRMKIYLRDVESGANRTLWESNDDDEETWTKGEVAYTYGSMHKIVLEGIAKQVEDHDRAFRGYIAVDDVQFQPIGESEEHCKGHCTYEGGMCGWTNQEENDDFNWELGRGSQNMFTGPARDYISFGQNDQSGGFLYIESSFPRRPGDRALILSPLFTQTGESSPMCMKFATHMYGNGIGTLRVRIRQVGGEEETVDKIIWEMKGEAGNNWYLGQVPVSSPATSFHVIFEGIIGQNSLGNIAIDSVSFQPGSCPISPQTASRNSGDCTFEENMCQWHNPLPVSRVDDFDWLRQFSFGGTGPKFDHTKRSAEGYFINLSGDALQPQRGGTRAWLLSPELTPQSTTPKCMNFYYYMYERTIDPAGPSLGSLRIYIKTISDNGEELHSVWRLNNHQAQGWRLAKVPLVVGADKKPPLQTYQILVEGIWGDGRVGTIAVDDISFFDGNCPTEPRKAAAVIGECSFERDLCGWKNQSGSGSGPDDSQFSPSPSKALLQSTSVKRQSFNRLSISSKDSITWKLATSTSRPANLQDHTFRAPTGYIFFDVFNQNSMQYPVLRSPEFPGGEGNTPKCLSFWFTPFGRGESTVMSVSIVTQDTSGEGSPPEEGEKRTGGSLTMESKTLLWRMSTRRFDTSRPEWIYGQVNINSEVSYRIQFEGEASDGGFALDDITFYEGSCQTRPLQAAVVVATEAEKTNVAT